MPRQAPRSPRHTPPPVPRSAVGAVVVDRLGRVLLVRRANPPLAGEWTLPGGKVEGEESIEDAVVRELREETALEAQIVGALGAVAFAHEGFAYVIHEFLLVPVGDGAASRSPAVHAADDATDVRWVTRDELETLGVRPEATAIVDAGLALDARRRSGF